MLALAAGVADASEVQRDDFLAVAKKGWVFELRTNVRRRNPNLPEIRINSRDIADGSVCLIGEPMHPQTKFVISSFQALLRDVFDRDSQFEQGGKNIQSCHSNTRTFIRFYSRLAPVRDYNLDLQALDRVHQIGLPHDRLQPITSPAQASTYFGKRGARVHVIVMQPSTSDLSELQRDYFASILVEELFQAFTFGIDILKFDRDAPFLSKLQEHPENLSALAWGSVEFMKRLLSSNPNGLCAFDIFMLHALAQTTLENVNTEMFLAFVEQEFNGLLGLAKATLSKAEYANILDKNCSELPD